MYFLIDWLIVAIIKRIQSDIADIDIGCVIAALFIIFLYHVPEAGSPQTVAFAGTRCDY